MSGAINLTEGEEFLWPSANFWSGAEAAPSEDLYCLEYSVSLHNGLIFSSH